MKYLIIFSIFLIGCKEGDIQINHPSDVPPSYDVVVIDSCEYITYDSGILDQRVFSITHKGNCNNPIHIKK